MDLSGDLIGGELVNDPITAEYLVGLSTADAEELGELAVGKLALTVEPNRDSLTGGVIELPNQSVVEIVGNGDGDRHTLSV